MAFCSNCGTSIADDANFCSHCGKSQNDVSGPVETIRPGHWEFKEFRQAIGEGASFESSFRMDGGMPDEGMRRPIDYAVRQILTQTQRDGDWEPMEPIDAGSLYKSQRVLTDYKKSLLFGDKMILREVRVNFRRWVSD